MKVFQSNYTLAAWSVKSRSCPQESKQLKSSVGNVNVNKVLMRQVARHTSM